MRAQILAQLTLLHAHAAEEKRMKSFCSELNRMKKLETDLRNKITDGQLLDASRAGLCCSLWVFFLFDSCVFCFFLWSFLLFFLSCVLFPSCMLCCDFLCIFVVFLLLSFCFCSVREQPSRSGPGEQTARNSGTEKGK